MPINALLFNSVSNASAQLGDVYIDSEISRSVANDYIDAVLIQFRSVAINTIGQFSLFILERLAHFSDVLKRAIDNLQLGNKLKIQIVITPEEMDLNGIFASLGSDLLISMKDVIPATVEVIHAILENISVYPDVGNFKLKLKYISCFFN